MNYKINVINFNNDNTLKDTCTYCDELLCISYNLDDNNYNNNSLVNINPDLDREKKTGLLNI